MRWSAVVAALVTVTAACASPRPTDEATAPPPAPETTTTTATAVAEVPAAPAESSSTTTATPPAPTTSAAPARTTAAPAVTSRPTPPDETIDMVYVLDRRVTDEATADFEALAEATLTDPRGWQRARFRFLRAGEDAPYRIVLAEGDEVDRLCLPYDTYGKYSCQNGPVVALNADRWRSATPKWTGDLESYRRMLVNHEVGHLLGLRHPRPQCPQRGTPAPIMNQQSTELNGCLPNPWPLTSEIEVAARHDRKLAPGPGE